jgi:pSer/pThr/pTyr-binding forkhead associated (FHA) protein
MDKCPYCGAETRPGDNFCLNCGNRLLSATPSFQQAQPVIGDATIPASSDSWSAPAAVATGAATAGSGWNDSSDRTAANTVTDTATAQDEDAATVQATMDKIEKPAHFIVRNDKGDVLQEYALEKHETVIGRAPASDILLSKDKLTSRRHAIVRYENGAYVLTDERSANGTFVNGQQLEELSPRVLKDGDHIGIGEHELVFRTSTGASVEDLPTIAVPFNANAQEMTYRTREDEHMTAAPGNDFSTGSMNGDGGVALDAQPSGVPSTPVPVTSPGPAEPSSPAESTAPAPVDAGSAAPTSSAAAATPDTGITFNRLTGLVPPTVPDIAQLMAALTTLDGQVSVLQEQLNATQEAIRNHETDIVQAANQLRSGVRRVSERMDSTIASVARSRDEGDWASLMQLMEDVMNNPRDIEYVTKLARKARELNKVFQIHQVVLNTLAECNSLLRSLIGDEKS